MSSARQFLLLTFLTSLLAIPVLAASTPTLIYTFTGGSAGSIPQGTLLLDSSGALFGVTAQGGESGKGVAFKLTPPVSGGSWTESVLHSFLGADGASPAGGLLALSNTLVGVTTFGGASNLGTVFQLTPNGGGWTESVLHSFSGSDGANPTVRLVADGKGALYGITAIGGASNRGVVFQLKPPTVSGGVWTETVLHDFTGGSDGFGPFGVLLIDNHGALYGSTTQNSPQPGRVFRLRPPKIAGKPWAFKVLHNDLATFISVDYVDSTGTLFGTTLGPNAFFKLSKTGTEQILINNADYSLHGGSFGADVFKFTPPANENGTWTFQDLNPGFCFNNGMPTLDAVGTIYGYDVNVCQAPPHGAVYQWTP